MGKPALKIYSFIFLGYAVWLVSQGFSGTTKTLVESLGVIFAHLAAFSVVEGLTIVAIIQVVDLIMYLTNRFKTKVKKQRLRELQRAEHKAKQKVEPKVEPKVGQKTIKCG